MSRMASLFALGFGVIALIVGAAQPHPAPGTVYEAQWMWADKCWPMGCEVAKADPLGIRWSPWKSPQDAIKQMKHEALQSVKNRGRPVHLKIRMADGEDRLDDLSNIYVAIKELSRYVYEEATTTTTTTTTTALAKSKCDTFPADDCSAGGGLIDLAETTDCRLAMCTKADDEGICCKELSGARNDNESLSSAEEGWQIAQNSTSAHQSKNHVKLTSDDIAEIEETPDFDAASLAVEDRTTENPPPQTKTTTSDEITEMKKMANFTSAPHLVQHQTSEDSPPTQPQDFVYKAPEGLVRPLSACFAVVLLGYVAMTLMQQRLPRSHQD